MADKLEFTASANADYIENVLAKVSVALRERIVKRALRAAAQVVLEQSRVNLERVTSPAAEGNLLESLAIKTNSLRSKDITYSLVGATWPQGAPAHLVEFGHEASGWYAGNDRVEGREFLQPAVDSTQPQQERILVETIGRLCSREIKKGKK